MPRTVVWSRTDSVPRIGFFFLRCGMEKMADELSTGLALFFFLPPPPPFPAAEQNTSSGGPNLIALSN